MDFSKKNIITLLLLAILILAIPLGIKLIQTQQILKSKATSDPITFTSSSGAPNTVNCTATECSTTSSTIDINITSNLGPPP